MGASTGQPTATAITGAADVDTMEVDNQQDIPTVSLFSVYFC